MLDKVLAALDGKKTYILASVMALYNLALAFNLISPDHAQQINVILGSCTVAALRSAVNK
jgi:hypothetical protein